MKLEELLKLEKKDIKGKIIVFPTDTVYGVGCMIDDEVAVKKIYDLKNRPYSKPLAILASRKEDFIKYVKPYPSYVDKLMSKYWPGPLTIVFAASDEGNLMCNANLNTIGFRIPNSCIALSILEKFGPMATTSVNISSEEPLNDPNEIKKQFGDKIDIIITDPAILSTISSTVVDITKEPYAILRKGAINL